jgi:hypothetical protein
MIPLPNRNHLELLEIIKSIIEKWNGRPTKKDRRDIDEFETKSQRRRLENDTSKKKTPTFHKQL